MKKPLLLALALVLTLGACGTVQQAAGPTLTPAPSAEAPRPRVVDYDVRTLAYPELPDVPLPEATRIELPNGLVVLLAEDHRLPLVRATARVGAGSLWEPAEEVGLASVTGTVMRTGGVAAAAGMPAMSPDELNAALEGVGATVEVGIGDDAASASMSVLTEHGDTVLPLFAAVLTRPAFDPQQVELTKTQRRSAIARRNDNPQSVATREFFKLVYGPESPYARTTEYWTIDAITRDDLVSFHRRWFHPNNTLVAVWGDFDASEMEQEIRAAFADWPRAEGFERPAPPPVPTARQREIRFIRKDDVTQSTVLIGHPGEIRLDDPDYFAVLVMNEILGGGFSSRLFQTVRSDLGLAYAVFGQYGADYLTPGAFYSGTYTKSESTVEAARAMFQVLEGMRTNPPTDAELSQAKESYLNAFVFNSDTKGEVLARQLEYEFYGYPGDFLQRTKAGVEAVTAADVQRVAERYLHPDEAAILVLGRPEDFGEPAAALGPVEEVDITIPTAPSTEN